MIAMVSQITGVKIFQADIKENIQAPRRWPLWGEYTGHRCIFLTKGQ